MDAPGEFQKSSVRRYDPRVRETRHRRAHSPDLFVIHHLLMAGDPNAEMLPEPAGTVSASGKKKVQKQSGRTARK
jgi:hypothetical protein